MVTGQLSAATGLLAGRNAIVTGGGRGVGREIALAFTGAGASVIVVARTMPELRHVAAEGATVGARPISVRADVTRETDVRRVVAKAVSTWGNVDILVNNAGVTPGAARGPVRELLDVATDFWDLTFAVNCRAPFLMMREALPAMLAHGRGTIINVTSKLSHAALAGNAPYGPSKSALELLTLIVDAEYWNRGVRANLLHPGGPVATSIFNEHYQPANPGDVRPPSIIREAAVWLASSKAENVHGSVVDARKWADHSSPSATVLGAG